MRNRETSPADPRDRIVGHSTGIFSVNSGWDGRVRPSYGETRAVAMKVLVVEDSPRLRKALTEGLHRSGFVFDMAEDGVEGLNYADTYEYDVVVLDLMLPKMDGITLLQRLRDERNRARVLILSARDGIDDRVRGLELGADDYLVKPFAFEELVARIRSLVRRRHDVGRCAVNVGRVSIDTAAHRAACGDEELPLTPGEYNLLEYLAMRRGRVISGRIRLFRNRHCSLS